MKKTDYERGYDEGFHMALTAAAGVFLLQGKALAKLAKSKDPPPRPQEVAEILARSLTDPQPPTA